ncbi:MAG: protocatechuate 3,4-dioxygenase [Pigmentiphaga sp.]
MAKIVLGMACSHGPMLATPPELWSLRAGADKKNKQHWYRGKTWDYESLLTERAPGFAASLTPEVTTAYYERCQQALKKLADTFAAHQPDLVILLGNDQNEVFHECLVPGFTVYTGSTIQNIPLSPEQMAALPPGIAIAEPSHCPEEGAEYEGAPECAASLVTSLVDQHFDVATSTRMPGGEAQAGIPHAFGFLYRQIMRDAPPPSIPIFTNVGVGLNRPRLSRCLAFGHALKRAIDLLPDELTVAVIASGGMTHFCIDEELDQEVLAALAAGDEQRLAKIPEAMLNGNTAELKSWYPLMAMMNDVGFSMELFDYVPCYRTEAGTGNAMGFAVWQA